jgi:hypothetical protein
VGTRHTYQRTLLQACLVAGDEAALAEKLGVPASMVVAWLLGDKIPPTKAFLDAVDIVLARSQEQLRKGQALTARRERMIDDIQALLADIKRRYPASGAT